MAWKQRPKPPQPKHVEPSKHATRLDRSGMTTARYRVLLRQLDQIEKLREQWREIGDVAPDDETLECARRVLTQISNGGFRILFAGNRRIVFEFDQGRATLVLPQGEGGEG